MSITKERLQELLLRARANAASAREKQAVEQLQQAVAKVDEVDTSKLGITDETLKTDAGQDVAVDILRDVAETADKSADTAENQPVVAQVETATVQNYDETEAAVEPTAKRVVGVARDDIIFNAKQEEFRQAVVSGKDVVLIGAAGTGKTTSMRKTMQDLIETGRIKNLHEGTKWLSSGLPGAIVVSYTRKAVNNIRHAIPELLKPHTLTIHKVLEFAPVYYEIEDPAKPGFFKTTMRFEPSRHRGNPLPASLSFIATEESSMVSCELDGMLMDACSSKPQRVFLGDIQQLPPIFGLAILGFKMLELPVVELTEVYRQALESPIIDLAWRILGGNPHDFSSKKEQFKIFSEVLKKEVTRIKCPTLEQYTVDKPAGKTVMQVWQKQLSSDHGLLTATKQFCAWSDSGYYDPAEDIILMPFNKAFGTIELNKGIMQYLGTKRKAVVFEIIAGFNKHYLAIGDRVLYDKEDAVIVDIARNGDYLGKPTLPPSKQLDRWGHMREAMSEEEQQKLQAEESKDMDPTAIEHFMDLVIEEAEERVNAASHVVTVRIMHSDDEVELESASDINNLLGGYAITVHKAQGSEWEKVFFVMHNTHAVMNQRELLYTAVTRARKFLHIICEPDTFERGVKSQRIKGNTLAEKAEFFKGKQNDRQQKLDLAAAMDAGKEPSKIQVLSGKPAIKLEDLVPQSFRNLAQESLNKHWDVARLKFAAAGDIGEKPTLEFNIRSKRLIGQAVYGTGTIRLNPIWCSVSDEAIKEHIITETIVHEICHFVSVRVYKEAGHGSKWRLCMVRMGVPPNQIHTGPIPPYLESKKELLQAVFNQHEGLQEQTTDEDTQDESAD